MREWFNRQTLETHDFREPISDTGLWL